MVIDRKYKFNQRISVDTFGPYTSTEMGFNYIVGIFCTCMNYVRLVPVKEISSITISHVIIKDWIIRK